MITLSYKQKQARIDGPAHSSKQIKTFKMNRNSEFSDNLAATELRQPEDNENDGKDSMEAAAVGDDIFQRAEFPQIDHFENQDIIKAEDPN